MKKRVIYQIPGNSGQKLKWTTKEMAALHFLGSIVMQHEEAIRKGDYTFSLPESNAEPQPQGVKGDNAKFNVHDPETAKTFRDLEADDLKLSSSSPGQRLKGPTSINVRFPSQYRHKLLRLPAEAAVIRQWESRVLSDPPVVSSCRVYFSRMRNYPTAVCTIIPYSQATSMDKTSGQSRKKVHDVDVGGDSGPDESDYKDDANNNNDVFHLPSRDWRGTSYLKLFYDVSADDVVYSPSLVDDFHVAIDGEKTNPKFDALTGPVKCTIIQFVQPKALGAKINKNFRDRNPNIPISLTLTTIRWMKRSMLLESLKTGIDVSTVALACVYFESLCLRNMISKANRRLAMAACIVLAYKFNESVILTSDKSKKFRNLISFFDRAWQVSSRDLFSAEFGVFVKLKFKMHVGVQDVFEHFRRLLVCVGKTPQEYLGVAELDRLIRSVQGKFDST